LRRIVGPDGRDVPLPPLPPTREVMTPAEAYVLTSLLTSVVQSGTATAAKRLARPIAGKTGTSNDARDTWFVGYTPELVAGVWVGYDDRRPLGRRESGAKSALPVWIELMGTALRGKPVVDFPVPSGVMVTRIDPDAGRARGGLPRRDAADRGRAAAGRRRPEHLPDGAARRHRLERAAGSDPLNRRRSPRGAAITR
jgi:membrane carboxypeptidase/penicillin-binding protein